MKKTASKKLETSFRKCSDDLRQLQNDLDDSREGYKLENDRNNAKIKHFQEELQEVQTDYHDLQIDLRKTEGLLREKEDDIQKMKGEYEDTKLILEEAQDILTETQDKFEKLKLEAKQKEESLTTKLEVAVKEAKEESKEKERQSKLRAAAEQRVEELEWYFLPVEEQEKRKDYSTPALKLLRKMKKETLAELDEIRKKHTKRNESVDELHKRLVEGLKNIPDTNKEVVAYQLQGLMQALEAATFPIRIRMKISVTLIEGMVDAEIVRELRILTEIMVDDSLHFLETPETTILLAQRELDEEKASPDYQSKKRSEVLNFRDILLERLARIRARRMNLPVDEVRQGILDEQYTKTDG